MGSDVCKKLELDTMPCIFGGPHEMKGMTFYPILHLKELKFERLFLEHTEGCEGGHLPFFRLYGYRRDFDAMD